MITIDGSAGEGGGQILRSCLTLAMLTGQSFRLEKIRAKRDKPGLMRQHLTCVNAARDICGAVVDGAALRATEITFHPGPVRPGTYNFAVGTAGSAMLVAQTLLLPLAQAGATSNLIVEGGTHNSKAPPYEFIDRAFLPAIARMGFKIEASLERRGFYPVGGGRVRFAVTPSEALVPIDLLARGQAGEHTIEALISRLPIAIAKRELDVAGGKMAFADDRLKIHQDKDSLGPGNALLISLVHDEVTEVFTGFGELGVSAELVAKRAAKAARSYLHSPAVIGPHLADQLLLPLALARGGRFTTQRPSLHTRTNIDVIAKFLPAEIRQKELSPGFWEIEVLR